jgi:hypothetical protein
LLSIERLGERAQALNNMVDRFPIGFIDAYSDMTRFADCYVRLGFHDQLADPGFYFLVGKRGSGKSATIIQLMGGNADDGTIITWDRKRARYVDYFQIFVKKMISIREYTYRGVWEMIDPATIFRAVWKYVINVSAMKDLVARDSLECSPEDLSMVKSYLTSNGLYRPGIFTIYKRLIEKIAEFADLEDPRSEQVTKVVGVVEEIFSDPDYEAALEAFERILECSGASVTVYVDAIMDRVLRGDELLVSAVLGLMLSVYEINSGQTAQNYIVKCTIPGETFDQIEYFDLLKLKERTAYTRWSRKDLKEMIDERLRRYLRDDGQGVSEGVDPWEVLFPAEVLNRMGKVEQSFYYACRHTHHFPREIILVTNSLLRKTAENGFLTDQEFIEAVHEACRESVLEFRNRSRIYKSGMSAVLRAFSGAKKVLDWNNVRNLLKPVSNDELKPDDWIEMLLSIGFLGVVMNMGSSKADTIDAKFTYRTGSLAVYSQQTWFAIHPLFYETYHIDRDGDRFVYPISYNE